jgi:hypothetical protein
MRCSKFSKTVALGLSSIATGAFKFSLNTDLPVKIVIKPKKKGNPFSRRFL